jgi:hypothetical protein
LVDDVPRQVAQAAGGVDAVAIAYSWSQLNSNRKGIEKMQKTNLLIIAIAGTAVLLASTGWANVPAPPVNQELGMLDASFDALTEADCRFCHDSGVPDRHHGLYDSVVSNLSVVPYPEFNIPGSVPPQELYSCMSCHSDTFILERDCTACHDSASPHHQTSLADDGDCVACHGDLVDNRDDGHYIPTYAPSLVTPTRSQGDADQLNSYGNGAGACNYCHDQDVMPPGTPVLILSNQSNHHGTNLVDFGSRCGWCHDFGLPFTEQIRVCEDCHGPDSLHNIQADSGSDGVVVGGELAGYGHVGRDLGPDDSDCWGCHGFAGISAAPGSGPIIPMVYNSDSPVIGAGTDTAVTLAGASFTNVAESTTYVSDAELTAGDGSSVTLTPDTLDGGALVVTIPGDTAPGNYDLRAVKANVASNPTVISIVPDVTITKSIGGKTVTITGSGFGGYAAGSGTSVVGTLPVRGGKNATTTTVEGEIVSWSDTKIEADFGSKRPNQVTVNSVFGSDTATVKQPTGRKRGK